jgi:hypothetical protein
MVVQVCNLAHERLRQEDQKFKVHLCYIQTLSQKRQKQKENLNQIFFVFDSTWV